MKRLGARPSLGHALPALCSVLLCSAACGKKEPRPQRTEPWLAHASARASGAGDAAPLSTRYVLGSDSLIRFEIPTKQGALSGSLTRVTGELNVDLANLTQSRGTVRAELGSLEIHAKSSTSASESTLLERARTALELAPEGGAPPVFASFDLNSVEDASPPAIDVFRDLRREPAREHDASAASTFSRHARFTAVGDLLLHGFRVVRRAPLSAEFTFAGDRGDPQSVSIRSRTPFVVSLETHGIVALAPESRPKGPGAAPIAAREAHVTIELYGTKAN